MCIFNDGGSRLRQEGPGWLQSEPWAKEPEIASTWAVLKSHEPKLTSGPKGGTQSSFFKELYELLPGRVILVMNADDLRRNDAAISRSLSWERSIRDLVGRIEDETFGILVPHVPKHVVVTFDYDAALYLCTSATNKKVTVEKAILVFSTNRSEGEYQSEFRGSMPGAQTVFTSVLAGLVHTYFAENPAPGNGNAGELLSRDDILIEKVLTYALIAKQRMLRCGFEPVTDKNMFIQTRETAGNRTILRLSPTLMYHEAIFALPSFRQEAEKSNMIRSDRVH